EAADLIKHIQKVQSKKLPIYLLGESLGTGVATWLAANVQVQGLILISPYTSFVDLASTHYPWLPVNLLLKNRFSADKLAKNVNSNVLAFHGMQDNIIPIKFARKQMTNFSCTKKLIEFDNAGHNDITITGRTIIQKEVKKFILSF
ncbi:MAG: alpha/beta hydrolase, partial [Thermodesulfobacteriota bacterium]